MTFRLSWLLLCKSCAETRLAISPIIATISMIRPLMCSGWLNRLMASTIRAIETTIKKVADKKGLSVVVDKNTVVYGGLDITDEVSKALQSGK